MHLAINDAVDRLSSIIAIQSWWRGIKARDHIEEMEYSAVAVQANWRRYLAQMSYQFDIIDVIIVQSVARRWETCRTLAAVRLQCSARTMFAKMRYRENLAMYNLVTRHSAATRIQARWRSHTAQMSLLHFIAATRIQARWRSFAAQMDLLHCIASTRIQAAWRCHVAREEFLIYRSAVKIQTCYRRYVAMEDFLIYRSAIKIQACYRRHVAIEDFVLERSAMKIQSTWRSYTAQVHMLISIVNVIVIQVGSCDCISNVLVLDLFA